MNSKNNEVESSAVRRISRFSEHFLATCEEQDETKVEKDIEDWCVPNETWTEETLRLYSQLKEKADSSNGEWQKLVVKPSSGPTRHILQSNDERGKTFEYACFVNRTQQRVHGLVQFGPYLEGPKGVVQGGAVATVIDSSSVQCAILVSQRRCFTVNLNVNYKWSVPLGSTVLVQTKIDRMVGRKIYISSEMTSPDGEKLFATSTALFVRENPNV